MDEYETAIFIEIHEFAWNFALETLVVVPEVISYYESGARVRQESATHLQFYVEKKTTIKECRFLTMIPFNEERFLLVPSRRRRSRECATYDPKGETITSVVVRYVVKKFGRLRISLEKQLSCNGSIKLFIRGDMEYDSDVFASWNKLREAEAHLVSVLMGDATLRDTLYKSTECDFFDAINPKDLMSIKCRVFSKFSDNSLNPNNVLHLKPKWDGFKARAVVVKSNDDEIVHLDDLGKFDVIGGHFLRPVTAYKNLIFQTEVVSTPESEPNLLVITDVLGVVCSGKQYMPCPEDVLVFFKFLKPKIENHIVNIRNGHYKLTVTETIPLDLVDTPVPHTDGFIIVGGGKEYKFKIPTIDLRAKQTGLYLDDPEERVQKFPLPEEVTPDGIGGIYEVCQVKDKVMVLRRRYDRIFSSTIDEWRSYLKERDYLRSVLKSYKSRKDQSRE